MNKLYKILKAEIQYDKLKFISYSSFVAMCFIVQSIYPGNRLYLLSYGILFAVSLVMFMNTYTTWRTEDRLASFAKLPIDMTFVWQLRTIKMLLYLGFFLIFLILFQLFFDTTRSFYDKIIIFLNNIGVGVTALFLYDINRDSKYIKSKKRINLSNKSFETLKLIVNGIFIFVLLYGAISISFMSAYGIEKELLINPSAILLITITVDIIPIVLYHVNKNRFLRRNSFIDMVS